MLPLNSPSHNFDSISQIRNLADRRYSVATKKSYSVKLSAVARDLDRAIKALEKIQKKKATLAPDAARQLDQGVQDLSQARKLVAATCVGKKLTAVFSSGSGS